MAETCACGLEGCLYPRCPQGDYARERENGEVYFYSTGGHWFVDDEGGVRIDGPYDSFAELTDKWFPAPAGKQT